MVLWRKDNIIEDFHGTKVTDPYRWLEDPDSEETQSFVNEMRKQCEMYFSQSETRNEDKKRLEELWNYPKVSVPRIVEGWRFYSKNSGLQNQPVLYVQVGEKEEVLLDPNRLSDDGTIALMNYSVSYDAEYIAYALSTHGSDWQEIR